MSWFSASEMTGPSLSSLPSFLAPPFSTPSSKTNCSEEIQDTAGVIEQNQAPLAGGQCPLFPATLLQQIKVPVQCGLFASGEEMPLAPNAIISG